VTMPTFTDGNVVHQASLNALSTGINNINTTVTGAAAPRSYVPTVRLRRVAGQNITNNTNTTISWDTIDVNNDNMFTLVSPTQITIQTAGSYAFDCEFGFTLNGSGHRVIWGTKNGTSTTANSVATDEQTAMSGATGRGNTMHMATVMPNCVVGDTFFVIVFQDSGVTLTSITSGFQPVSSLSMWRIGQ